MRVLFAAVEMAPLAKVGGLADVAGSLPAALRGKGLDTRVVMPAYRGLRDVLPASPLATIEVGGRPVELLEAAVNRIPVYLISNPEAFEREEIYGYPDDLDRWDFYCSAAMLLASHLGWSPELLHLNEWHSAFIAARLRGSRGHPWAGLPSLYTIHNLAIRGDFDWSFRNRSGLPAAAFDVPGAIDPSLAMNAMALGILNSTAVSTVSRTYAREILTPEYGAGLDPLLRTRAGDGAVTGIVNGIDYEEWNPAADPRLPANFDEESIVNRAANKAALQARLGLAQRPGVPLLGMVGRLFYQKGADLAAEAVSSLAQTHDFQFCVLGTGDEENHRVLRGLQARFPDLVSITLAFAPDLAALIYGGSDIFLMPSRFEPCGLGQLIAMRYGSVPIVRKTGGLADTVEDAGATLSSGTGFVFEPAEAAALAAAIRRALDAYRRPSQWRELQLRCMRRDVSWEKAAGEYEDLYRRIQGGAGVA